MSSIIKFTPLLGANDDNALCYLLQLDEFRLLLDCGLPDILDSQQTQIYLQELSKIATELDAVLISHPDILHLGALPYLVGRCGLRCPIYATVPIHRLGHMFLYDFYATHVEPDARVSTNGSKADTAKRRSKGGVQSPATSHTTSPVLVGGTALFDLDDVDSALERIQQVKYRQPISLKGTGAGVQVTALPAGHLMGGTMWRINKDSGEEEIVYAVDFCHTRERHLDAAALSSELPTRPALLITDAFNAQHQPPSRKIREEHLVSSTLKALRARGNVLIATDSAGRMLELAFLLEQCWSREQQFENMTLTLLSNVAQQVLEFARSLLEWSSEKLLAQVPAHNPFDLPHVRVVHTLDQLRALAARGPTVALASGYDLEVGFARSLFLEWVGSPNNAVILTSRSARGTLSRFLIDNKQVSELRVPVKKRVPLEGAELEEFYRRSRQPSSEQMDEGQSENAGTDRESRKRKRRRLSGRREAADAGVVDESDDSSSSSIEDESDDEKPETAVGPAVESTEHDIKDIKPLTQAQAPQQQPDSSRPHRPLRLSSITGTAQLPFDLPAANSHIPLTRADAAKDHFFKKASVRPNLMVFPSNQPPRKWDDYGEFIRLEDIEIKDSELGVGLGLNFTSNQLLPKAEKLDFATSNQSADAKDSEGEMVRTGSRMEAATSLTSEPSAGAALARSGSRAEPEPIARVPKSASAAPPSKWVTLQEEVAVRAHVEYIDFEGRSDGDSVRKIILQIRPRELILVHGTSEATRALQEQLTRHFGTPETTARSITGIMPFGAGGADSAQAAVRIHAPRVGEVIDATKEGHMVQVKLTDALISSLKLVKTRVPETEVAWLDARVLPSADVHTAPDSPSPSPALSPTPARARQSEALPVLGPLARPPPLRPAVLLCEPRLSDLKQALLKRGIPAELSAGHLLVNGVISIRKNETGRLDIEGPVCDDMFLVRSLLYSEYVII